MSSKIFINYRRDDDAGMAGRIYDRLENEFGVQNVFMDVGGTIQPGNNFVRVLNDQVQAANVFLAIIGPRWTNLLTERRHWRDDFVAIEISSALKGQKRIIPILLNGARMPQCDALPEDLRGIAQLQAVLISGERFRSDITLFIASLRRLLADLPKDGAQIERSEREAEAAEKLLPRRDPNQRWDESSFLDSARRVNDEAAVRRFWGKLVQP